MIACTQASRRSRLLSNHITNNISRNIRESHVPSIVEVRQLLVIQSIRCRIVA